MPRPTVKKENTEDLMTDAVHEEWETVSKGYGEKILWDTGVVFTGTFNGTRDVEVDDGKDGFTTALAAEFTNADGETFWCWLPYQLKEAIQNGTIKEDDKVRITCTGEQSTKRGLNPVKTFTIQVQRKA